ncbi:hypothetical protein Lser_V15G17696 [Lactuca serriola]
MSMYGYDVSFYDYGFSDPAINGSIYGNSISRMAPATDYDDDIYVRRRPPPRPRQRSPSKTPSSPPKHRHDGTSPLPLGMDWSLPPLNWEGRNSVWPHDLHKGWSYCVTIPSLSSEASAGSSVFYGVKVGIQSPEGITTTRTVPRRFNDFLNLYSELKKEFPKKSLPPHPPKSLLKTRSKKVLVNRMCALEGWMTKLLSDIDVSRTAHVAIFLELEAAAREACCELNQNEYADMDNNCAHETSDHSAPEEENYDEITIENVSERGINNSIGENIIDMEELQTKCRELELRVTTEQEARAYAESMKETMIQKNEMLMKEIEILRKEKDEVELKSKSDIEEVNSLITSHSELKEELNKCLEEKVELEKEKQKWEDGNASKATFLNECEILCNRLQECSAKFLVEDDKLIMNASSSNVIDVLEISDTQIDLLLEEVQVVGENCANEDDDLRKLFGNILIENAKLRKQINSITRHAMSKKHGNTLEDNVEE